VEQRPQHDSKQCGAGTGRLKTACTMYAMYVRGRCAAATHGTRAAGPGDGAQCTPQSVTIWGLDQYGGSISPLQICAHGSFAVHWCSSARTLTEPRGGAGSPRSSRCTPRTAWGCKHCRLTQRAVTTRWAGSATSKRIARWTHQFVSRLGRCACCLRHSLHHWMVPWWSIRDRGDHDGCAWFRRTMLYNAMDTLPPEDWLTQAHLHVREGEQRVAGSAPM
jgi:hypothetical protein